MPIFLRLVCAAAACLPLTLAAAAIEPLENIRAAAREAAAADAAATGRPIEIEVGRLDPRLRLARCPQPLTASLAPGNRSLGYSTVGVRCDGAAPWTIFVPVTVKQTFDVAVVTTPLARGQTITAADVRLESLSVATARTAFFQSLDEVIGMQAQRPVAAGTVLAPAMVKAPRAVRRGERVVLALSAGTVSVRVAGTALKDAALGERVPVRNASSRRVVEGVVSEPGVVEVTASMAAN